jgi:hypothetical protein
MVAVAAIASLGARLVLRSGHLPIAADHEGRAITTLFLP